MEWAETVKRCQRFLLICPAKCDHKTKKCRPHSVSGIFPSGSAVRRENHLAGKNMSAAGKPLRRTVFLRFAKKQ